MPGRNCPSPLCNGVAVCNHGCTHRHAWANFVCVQMCWMCVDWTQAIECVVQNADVWCVWRSVAPVQERCCENAHHHSATTLACMQSNVKHLTWSNNTIHSALLYSLNTADHHRETKHGTEIVIEIVWCPYKAKGEGSKFNNWASNYTISGVKSDKNKCHTICGDTSLFQPIQSWEGCF